MVFGWHNVWTICLNTIKPQRFCLKHSSSKNLKYLKKIRWFYLIRARLSAFPEFIKHFIRLNNTSIKYFEDMVPFEASNITISAREIKCMYAVSGLYYIAK